MKTYYNKKLLVFSFLLYLFPLALILLTYNDLPKTIPSHWNMQGQADQWMNKSILFIELAGMLALHIFLLFLQRILPDKHGVKYSKLASIMFYYFVPLLTMIVIGASIFSIYTGPQIISTVVMVFIGVIFLVTGNYLPKVRHNYWLGIKLPWTLASPSNWEKTHRFAGPIWALSGFIIIILGFLTLVILPEEVAFVIMAILIVISILVPTIYSYKEYKKEYHA